MANTPQQPFQFPTFNIPGLSFPFQSLPAQANAAFAPQQFTSGAQYGRWNGVNNNAFGLFPNQFQGLFGYQPQGNQMAFQPPWGNNGTLGSNQGPGANPGGAPAPGQPPGQPKIGGGLLGSSGQPPGVTNVSQVPQSPQPPNTAAAGLWATMNRMNPGASQQPQLQPGQFATNIYGAGAPQTTSVAQFNQLQNSNPALAYQLATHGGQDFRNAIMQQNGMSNDQLNNWLNNAAYNQGGLTYRFGG